MGKAKISFFGSTIIALASLFSPAPRAGEADSVAMVTDLQGKAVLVDDARKPGLSILSELRLDSRVQLAAGTRMALVYLQSGREFDLKGPAIVSFGAQEPKLASGKPVVTRGLALAKSGKAIRIKPVVVAQASIVMRTVDAQQKMRLFEPSGMSLSARPWFQWQAQHPDIQYRFTLLDDTGGSVFMADTGQTRLQLPETTLLETGKTYTWMVSARLPDGKQFSNAVDFAIAPESLRTEAAALIPAEGAPLSEIVVFATWLEQMQLHDEARAYWKKIAGQRKDDARLKVLAGE